MEEHKSTTQEKVSLVVPISIILAGIIIAGAILFSGAKSSSAPKNPADPAAAQLTKGTIAEEIGLDKGKFQECLTNNATKSIVDAQSQGGVDAGIQGTPYTVIIAKDGTQTLINGAQPFENVKQLIETALAGNSVPEKGVKVSPVTAADHLRGNPDADVKLVEYSDTECPFCQRFHATMLQVMAEYEKGGKVAWVYRYFPLDQLHSKARHEAVATECAFKIGGIEKFWAYLDTIEKITPTNNGLDQALL